MRKRKVPLKISNYNKHVWVNLLRFPNETWYVISTHVYRSAALRERKQMQEADEKYGRKFEYKTIRVEVKEA